MKKILTVIIIGILYSSMFSVLALNAEATDLGSWATKASMLTPRLRFAAVAHGGKIYAIGGSDRSGGGTERATSIVEIYDPATDSWTTGTPMPAPKYHTGAVVVGDRIYVMGHDSRLFSYDPALDVWTEHASVPADATYGFGIGVVDGKIYAVKGSPEYPSGAYWTYCYDPASNTWTSKTPLPFTRSTDSLATLNGKLYVIGGIEPTGGWVHCTRVDVYDQETDSWELDSIARLSVPRTHLEADTPVVNGKIYVIGGWNGYTALSTVEEYNPTTDSWQTLASMPTARYGLATAVVNDRIYALGGDWGGLGGHIQSVNEEFTPPAQPQELFTLPAGAKPSEPEIYGPTDNKKLLISIDIAGQGQIAYATTGQTLSASCTYQIWGNPSEINQGFFIMSWTPSWPPQSDYYVPIWNGISGDYLGVTDTETFSFTVPPAPGTYYLYWCLGAMYSMQDAVDQYDRPLALPAHAEIVVTGPRLATELTLKIPPRRVLAHSSVVFEGQLIRQDKGSGISDVQIKIHEKDLLSEEFLAEGRTDTQGRFAISWFAKPMDTISPHLLDKTMEVQARFEGSSDFAPSRSDIHEITIEPIDVYTSHGGQGLDEADGSCIRGDVVKVRVARYDFDISYPDPLRQYHIRVFAPSGEEIFSQKLCGEDETLIDSFLYVGIDFPTTDDMPLGTYKAEANYFLVGGIMPSPGFPLPIGDVYLIGEDVTFFTVIERFEVNVSGEVYAVDLVTTSDIVSLKPLIDSTRTVLELSGNDGTSGWLNLTVSKSMVTSLGGNGDSIHVLIDGDPANFMVSENDGYYSITVGYSHSIRVIEIFYMTPTLFPTALVLAVLIASIVLTVTMAFAFYLRRHKRLRSSSTLD